jgi:hypothetical protein
VHWVVYRVSLGFALGCALVRELAVHWVYKLWVPLPRRSWCCFQERLGDEYFIVLAHYGAPHAVHFVCFLACWTDFMMDVISGQVPDRFRADHPEFTADSLFGLWAQSKQVSCCLA